MPSSHPMTHLHNNLNSPPREIQYLYDFPTTVINDINNQGKRVQQTIKDIQQLHIFPITIICSKSNQNIQITIVENQIQGLHPPLYIIVSQLHIIHLHFKMYCCKASAAATIEEKLNEDKILWCHWYSFLHCSCGLFHTVWWKRCTTRVSGGFFCFTWPTVSVLGKGLTSQA